MKRRPYNIAVLLLLVMVLVLSSGTSLAERISDWLSRRHIVQSSDGNLIWAGNYSELLKLASNVQQRPSMNAFRVGSLSGAGNRAEAPASEDSYHSSTNVQVAGVGEADLIQTDGRYLYIAANQRLIIVDASDPENMRIVSQVKYEPVKETKTHIIRETPLEMYLDMEQNRLVMITSGTEMEKADQIPEESKPETEEESPEETNPEPMDPEEQNPGEIPDENPGEEEADPEAGEEETPDSEEADESSVDVNFQNARLAGAPDRHWIPYYPVKNFTTTRVYDISNRSSLKKVREFTQEGYYVTSRKIDRALYVVTNRTDYRLYYDDVRNLEPADVFPSTCTDPGNDTWKTVPAERIAILPHGNVSSQITLVGMDVLSGESAPDLLTVIGTTGQVYASRDHLYLAAFNYDWNFTEDKPPDFNTDIYRFRLNEGRIAEAGRGTVPGSIINQFSMDEHNGYFRIATTTGTNWMDADNPTKNNLYILDNQLQRVGEITGLAKGETIRSVRFMGDQAYMVTFRTVDPLFSLDLSDPRSPRVRGELKIPGYSTYLHPYNDELLIGFGYDVYVQGETAMNLGIKVSLFDISEFENPQEVSSIIFGGSGSYADVLYDHKSLLFSREKNLIAFPATLTPVRTASPWVYEPPIFQGLLVLGLGSSQELSLRGHISHTEWPGDPLAAPQNSQVKEWKETRTYDIIRRAVYMGNTLFTFSDKQVCSAGISDLKIINSLQLPGYEEYPDDIVYMDNGVLRASERSD